MVPRLLLDKFIIYIYRFDIILKLGTVFCLRYCMILKVEKFFKGRSYEG